MLVFSLFRFGVGGQSCFYYRRAQRMSPPWKIAVGHSGHDPDCLLQGPDLDNRTPQTTLRHVIFGWSHCLLLWRKADL